MTLWPCPLCKTLTGGVYCWSCIKKAEEKLKQRRDGKDQN